MNKKKLIVVFVSRNWQFEQMNLIVEKLISLESSVEALYVCMDNKHKGNSEHVLRANQKQYILAGPNTSSTISEILNDSLFISSYISTMDPASVTVLCDKNQGPDYYLSLGVSLLVDGRFVLFQHSENCPFDWSFSWGVGYKKNPITIRSGMVKVVYNTIFLFMAMFTKFYAFRSVGGLIKIFRSIDIPLFGCDIYFSFSQDNYDAVKEVMKNKTHLLCGSLLQERILRERSKRRTIEMAGQTADVVIFSVGAFRSDCLVAIEQQIQALSFITVRLNQLGFTPRIVFKPGEINERCYEAKIAGVYEYCASRDRFCHIENAVYIVPVDSTSVLELDVLKANYLVYSIFNKNTPQGLRKIKTQSSKMIYSPGGDYHFDFSRIKSALLCMEQDIDENTPSCRVPCRLASDIIVETLNA